jgi:hypothetical protein
LQGPTATGGLAIGAFFNIGPLGGFVGFAAGVLLFVKIGQSRSIKSLRLHHLPPRIPRARRLRPGKRACRRSLPSRFWRSPQGLLVGLVRTHSFALPDARLHDAAPAIQASVRNGFAFGTK